MTRGAEFTEVRALLTHKYGTPKDGGKIAVVVAFV